MTAQVVIKAAPVKIDKRLLLPTAPFASDIGGALLLLKNDVDPSNIIRTPTCCCPSLETITQALTPVCRWETVCTSAAFAFISFGLVLITSLISTHPQHRWIHLHPGSSGATELVSLLNNNANAQPEVAYSQFWVYNGNLIRLLSRAPFPTVPVEIHGS